jgi:hypothetical protein
MMYSVADGIGNTIHRTTDYQMNSGNRVPAVMSMQERAKLRTLFVKHQEISAVAIAVGVKQPTVTRWFLGQTNNMSIQEEVLLRAPDLIDTDREQFIEVQQYARAG